METIEKKKVLKTKLGILKAGPAPNSTFSFVEGKNGKKVLIETLDPKDIDARRNPAYKYLD